MENPKVKTRLYHGLSVQEIIDSMNDLEYFVSKKDSYIYCYDQDVEFFAVYLPKDNKWIKEKGTAKQGTRR